MTNFGSKESLSGIWFAIHNEAKYAIDYPSKLRYISFIKRLSDDFPCLNCKPHFQEYVKKHPFEDYWSRRKMLDGQMIEIGLFEWTVDFHNTVNKRLNKPIIDLLTAYRLFYKSEALCSAECGEESVRK